MPEESSLISTREINTYKAAFLSTQGHTQKSIGEILGVCQPTVGRWLKEARTQLKLIEDGRPTWTGSPAALREVKRLLVPEQQLYDRLRKLSKDAHRLLEVHILENIPNAGESKKQDFARRVAHFLLEEGLLPGDRIGVAFGGLLLEVAEQVERLHSAPSSRWGDLAVIPICVDPPEVDQAPTRSAANIAAHLETALTGRIDFAHNFSSVAGFIPKEFEGERAETIREFFRTIPGYQRVFGAGKSTRGGLISQLDGILTSVGTNFVRKPWIAAASKATGIDRQAIAAATPGNVGGLVLQRHEPSAEHKAIVDRVNKRWTGIRPEHLRVCTRRAAEDPGRLGVTVLACRGSSQSSVVLECVRSGYASRLLLDPSTADGVSKALSEELGDDGDVA